MCPGVVGYGVLEPRQTVMATTFVRSLASRHDTPDILSRVLLRSGHGQLASQRRHDILSIAYVLIVCSCDVTRVLLL